MVLPHNTATFAAAFSDIELVNTVYIRCSFIMLRLHASFHIIWNTLSDPNSNFEYMVLNRTALKYWWVLWVWLFGWFLLQLLWFCFWGFFYYFLFDLSSLWKVPHSEVARFWWGLVDFDQNSEWALIDIMFLQSPEGFILSSGNIHTNWSDTNSITSRTTSPAVFRWLFNSVGNTLKWLSSLFSGNYIFSGFITVMCLKSFICALPLTRKFVY